MIGYLERFITGIRNSVHIHNLLVAPYINKNFLETRTQISAVGHQQPKMPSMNEVRSTPSKQTSNFKIQISYGWLPLYPQQQSKVGCRQMVSS